jgi:CBS domain-containing protein
MTCKDLMTPEPAYCVPHDTVVTAAMLMKSHDVGSIPVVSDRDSRKVVGMITDRDIALRVVAEQRDYYNAHVEEIMTGDVVTCKPEDDYDEVVLAMKDHQLHRVPVVDSGKRLLGIIALADVARRGEFREVGHMVEHISRPAPEPQPQEDGRASRYTKTGLLVAGGLGLGAGLIYLLDPRWAHRVMHDEPSRLVSQ